MTRTGPAARCDHHRSRAGPCGYAVRSGRRQVARHLAFSEATPSHLKSSAAPAKFGRSPGKWRDLNSPSLDPIMPAWPIFWSAIPVPHRRGVRRGFHQIWRRLSRLADRAHLIRSIARSIIAIVVKLLYLVSKSGRRRLKPGMPSAWAEERITTKTRGLAVDLLQVQPNVILLSTYHCSI